MNLGVGQVADPELLHRAFRACGRAPCASLLLGVLARDSDR